MAKVLGKSSGKLITCWYEYAETLWNRRQVELLLVDVPRLKGTVTNSPGEDAVLAAEVINRRCLGFSYGSTSSALGMLSAEGGPKRKLTHHQATPFLILTCGVGFVTPRIFTSWSSNSLRCSFPTYPLTAVGPTKIVSNRQRPTVLRSSILRKGKPYLHG